MSELTKNQFPTEIQMYTRDEVAELFQTHKDFVTTLIELNILVPIKIGKRFMFSYSSIKEFQEKFKGYDLSNRLKALEAKKTIEMKNNNTQQ